MSNFNEEQGHVDQVNLRSDDDERGARAWLWAALGFCVAVNLLFLRGCGVI